MLQNNVLPSASERVNEKLPSFLDYSSKALAPPSSNMRYFEAPTNGSSFAPSANSGPLISFNINCGSPGVFLNTTETALCLTVVNTSAQPLTLDGSALALIESIDVYYGSSHISSIQSYANFVNTLSDFTSMGHHYVRGVADTILPDTYGAEGVENALKSRKGELIGVGGRKTFMLPIVNCLGTLAQKALPLSALKDHIRCDIRLAGFNDYGTYPAAITGGITIVDPRLWLTEIRLDGAVERALMDSLPNGKIHVPCFDVQSFMTSVQENAGAFTYQIPIKCSSLSTVLVTLRETVQGGKHDYRALSRTRANILDYRFRIGSHVIPSTFIDCTGTAAEARMELQRALNQLSASESHTFVDNELYTLEGADGAALAAGAYGCFAFALNLSSMSMAEILSDGMNTRNIHATLEVRFRTGTQPALRADIYAIKEQLLVVQGSLMHYED